MINPADIYSCFVKKGIEFFTGVPDSLLKEFCAYLNTVCKKENNIIAANEGGAVALACGYYLATGKPALVYMQNSGLGNSVNPLLSLADKEVYSIPMILMVGWRGEPGIKDEPQHVKQGRVTLALLESLEIPYKVIDNSSNIEQVIDEIVELSMNSLHPAALVVKKNSFESFKCSNNVAENYELSREQALELVISNIPGDSVIVSSTGMLSRELYEIRDKYKLSHKTDFLTVGSMGHASQIALGIALAKPERNVYIFDGDGAFLMHTGSAGIIGSMKPGNLKHVLFNNGAHDSVGGQPTIAMSVDLAKICKAFNYTYSNSVKNESELIRALSEIKGQSGPIFLEIKIRGGFRSNLGRPKTTAQDNKKLMMDYLGA